MRASLLRTAAPCAVSARTTPGRNKRDAHILTCRSPPPVANIRIVGLKSIDITARARQSRAVPAAPEFVCPCIIHCAWPVRRFQNTTHWSFDPGTTRWLSCDTAIDSASS